MDVKLVESLVISHIVNDQTYAIVIAQPNLHHQIGAIEIVDICRQSLNGSKWLGAGVPQSKMCLFRNNF